MDCMTIHDTRHDLCRGRSHDDIQFFRSWVRNPLRTAAVAPSGQALARLMTKEIDPSTGPVVELGPGTGVFTQALLNRGVAAGDLTLVESNPNFVDLLRRRFPSTRVVRADAADDRWTLHSAEVGAVVSGLPLLAMADEAVIAVLSAAFARLRPDGRFYQFTYAAHCPVRSSVLDALGLRVTLLGRTWRNLPPASAFRIERRG